MKANHGGDDTRKRNVKVYLHVTHYYINYNIRKINLQVIQGSHIPLWSFGFDEGSFVKLGRGGTTVVL